MKWAVIITFMLLTGCGSKLTGYNLKTTVGQTDYESGQRSLYTGASLDAHFDVK